MSRFTLALGIVLVSTVLCVSGFCLENPYIAINPLGDHEAGESFSINGTTSLSAGKILVIDIEPVRLHPAPSYKPPRNTTALTGRTITESNPAGNTSWSFIVNSTSLIPDNYTLRVTSFDLPIIDGSIDFNLKPGEEIQPTVRIQDGYWITVDDLPIGTHYVGDSFFVSGETNLPIGHEIVFGAFISKFMVGSPDLLPPSYAGSTLITKGSGEIHTWSFVINTTQFSKTFKNDTHVRSNAVAGDYTLSIGPLDTISHPFTLIERTETSREIPTRIETIDPNDSISQPPTNSTPLPVPLPIVALGIFCILAGLFRR